MTLDDAIKILKSKAGLANNEIVADSNKACKTRYLFPVKRKTSIKENMNEARTTEGANPVNNAYNHNNTKPKMVTNRR